MKCTSGFGTSFLIVGCVLPNVAFSPPAAAGPVTTPTVRAVFYSSTHNGITTSNAEAVYKGATYLRFDIEAAGWGGDLVSYDFKSLCSSWPCGGGGGSNCGGVQCPVGMCINGSCGIYSVIPSRTWIFESKKEIAGTTATGESFGATDFDDPVADTQSFQYLGSAFLMLDGCTGSSTSITFDLEYAEFILADGSTVDPDIEPATVLITCVRPPVRARLLSLPLPCGAGVFPALMVSLVGLVQFRRLRRGQGGKCHR